MTLTFLDAVICFVVFPLLMLLFYRNSLAFEIRAKEREIVSAKAKAAIYAGEPWEIYWDEFRAGPSYDRVMFDLRGWTHEYFYGRKAA